MAVETSGDDAPPCYATGRVPSIDGKRASAGDGYSAPPGLAPRRLDVPGLCQLLSEQRLPWRLIEAFREAHVHPRCLALTSELCVRLIGLAPAEMRICFLSTKYE